MLEFTESVVVVVVVVVVLVVLCYKDAACPINVRRLTSSVNQFLYIKSMQPLIKNNFKKLH